ncbi:MAG: hypothetical protein E6K70_09285 [Planctomycetota bacterium]|nr:MAG: hypothetical protein E6K70_09285 [Planctomycetota bacterium]
MPLLDHFQSALSDAWPWDGIHANWATKIADQLNAEARKTCLRFKSFDALAALVSERQSSWSVPATRIGRAVAVLS